MKNVSTTIKVAAGVMATGAALFVVGAKGRPQRPPTGDFALAAKASPRTRGGATAARQAATPNAVKPVTLGYQWKSAPIVGGGFVSGIILHPKEKGLMYARTDIGGAYRWDNGKKRWESISDWVNSDTWNYSGIESLGIDPSDPKRVYLAAGTYTNDWAGNGALFRSVDKGATWRKTELPFKLGGNEAGRFAGERLVADPNRGEILFLGTRRNGLWKSADYGATWAQVMSFPVTNTANGVGIGFVVFDGRGGASGAATQTIYAGVSDTASPLYRSVDGGATWQAAPNQPTGLLVNHGVLDRNGVMYLTYGNAAGPNGMTAGAVYKFDTRSGTWTDITPEKGSFGYGGVAVDQRHPGTLVATTMDRWGPKDEIFRSRDGGATWAAIGQKSRRDARLAPWLTWGKPTADAGHWMGDIEIDPFDSDHALYVTGTGVWTTANLTVTDSNRPALWTVGAVGLEECVANEVISPPSGAPLFSVVWDIDGFRHDTLQASPTAGFFQPAHGHNWGIDFAEKDPNILARVFSGGTLGAYSGDNGKTWTNFAAKPLQEKGQGKIAVSADGAAFVFTTSEQGGASFSRDRGATWTASAGLPGTFARVVSDRMDASRFYAFNTVTGALLTSADGGATFRATGATLLTGDGFLRAAPGKAGDLWLASAKGVYHSADRGATFVRASGMDEARRIGFGKAAPGRTAPAVYVSGKKNDVYGFYRSNDSGASWTRINDDGHQFAGINSITGDPRVYGRLYIASQSRGVLYGDPPPTR